MTESSIVNRTIGRCAGLREGGDPSVGAENYLAVIETVDKTVFLLGQGAVVGVDKWPTDVESIPIRVLDGGKIEGNLVTNVILRGARGDVGGANGPQLFIILDGERLMGVVPTQRGAVLHVEAILTSPLVHKYDDLRGVDGRPLALDDIVAM